MAWRNVAQALPLTVGIFLTTILLFGLAAAFGEYLPNDLLDCSSSKLIVKRYEIINALLSPALVRPATLWQIISQLIGLFVLALIEYANLKALKSRRNVFSVFVGLAWIFVIVIRVILGHIFSRGVGWAYPSLFMNDAAHECSTGLCPWLYALNIATVPFWSTEIFTPRFRGKTYSIRSWAITFSLTCIGCVWSNTLWWSSSGIIAGVVLLPLSVRWINRPSKALGQRGTPADEDLPAPASKKRKPPKSTSSVVFVAMLLFAVGLTVVLVRYQLHEEEFIQLEEIVSLSRSPQEALLTTIFITAPRPRTAGHLKETVESFVNSMPRHSSLLGFYKFVVYTSFTTHPEFLQSHEELSRFTEVRWLQEDNQDFSDANYERQRRDFSRAISSATKEQASRYYMIVEDDFPLCENGWDELNRLLVLANSKVPNHCGMFVATGGSGLIFKADMAQVLQVLLSVVSVGDQEQDHADLVIQKCLRGQNPKCSKCRDTLVTSQTMLMRHVGYNSSTTKHSYEIEQYQCGWRQPFNGEADVVTI